MRLFSFLLFLFITFSNTQTLYSAPKADYELYIRDWEKNIALASQYLRDAENSMKNGDKLLGCSNQKKASLYGVKATESLIQAFIISGSMEDLSDLKSGLNKWRELGDFCY